MNDSRPRRPLRYWLEELRAQRRALMAFNVQNLPQLVGLVTASERTNRPVIAQMSAKYAARESMRAGLGEYLALACRADVYLHLDHCTDVRLIHHCIRQGFDSVMYDGSVASFAENVARTNEVAGLAGPAGCLVEAELGRIGGIEDDSGSEVEDAFSAREFADFCQAVKADMVAPAIGNAHGFYSNPDRVRIDLLPEAQACLRDGQWLVLHGGTGLSAAAFSAAIQAGVVKINISTHLKQRTQEVVREVAAQTLYDEHVLTATVAKNLVEFFSDYIRSYTTC